MKKFMVSVRVWGVVCIVFLGVGGLVGYVFVRQRALLLTNNHLSSDQLGTISQTSTILEAADALSLIALKQDDLGIEPQTDFELTSKSETNIETIKNSLHFSPQIDFVVAQKDPNTFLITPNSSLAANTVITASYLTTSDNQAPGRIFSWAYQTKGPFQILTTLPADAATNVPLSTGIEVNFSQVNVENVETHFSISPETKGKFEYHEKTVSFVPDQPLEPKTIYTVSVGKDVGVSLEHLDQDYSFQFETTTDQAHDSLNNIETFERETYETSSTEPPTFILLGSDLNKQTNLEVEIYSFQNADKFSAAYQTFAQTPWWAVYSKRSWNIPTQDLTLYASFTASLTSLDSWRNGLAVPEALPKGYYLVKIKDQDIQTLLQVTDISAFMDTSKTDLVIWAHDEQTKQPIPQLNIYLPDHTLLGQTNSSGVFRESMPTTVQDQDFRDKNLLTLSIGTNTLLLPLQTNHEQAWGVNEGEEYWSYLYLDQPFYKPVDDVNYWGMVQSRYQATVPQVTAELIAGSRDNAPIETQKLDLGTYGSFEGSFHLDHLQPGGYYVVLKAGDENLFSKYFTVLTYQKPTFQLKISPEQSAVYSGESFTHQIAATYFDGTPVGGLDISVGDTVVTTGEDGIAQFTKTYTNESSHHTLDSTSITAHPTFGEEAEITAYANVLVYPGDYIIHFESPTISGQTANIQGTLSTTDLTKLPTEERHWWNADVQGAAVKQSTVHLTITKDWYTKTPVGTGYDFLQKKSYPTYTYKRDTAQVSEQDIETDDSGKFNLSFPMEKESNYTFAATVTDDQGRIVGNSVYVSHSFYQEQTGQFYSVKISDGKNNAFSVGDSVPVEFLENNKSLPDTNQGDFLFVVSQQGIRSVITSATPKTSFTFSQQFIPDVVVQGVWYDGRSYWYSDALYSRFSGNGSVSFNEKERAMKITVNTDKQKYGPGDTVDMDIQATKADGSTDTTVLNVDLIDEAIYHLLPDDGWGYEDDYQSEFNSVLYRNISSGVLSSYASHYYPKVQQGAEGGGGGDARTDFPDKALFKTLTTDHNGKAHLTFTLPDNITSWRANVHALSSGIFAGSQFFSIPVTKLFFVSAVMNFTYLASDSPVIKVKASGESLHADTPVKFTVQSPDIGLDQEVSTTGSTSVDIPLPKLLAGHYKIEIKGEVDGFSDDLIRDLDVEDTYTRWQTQTSASATPDWMPTPTESVQFVTITDQQKGQFYPLLVRALYHYGDRLDERIGRMLAAKMLKTYFNEDAVEEQIDPSEYQNDKGGLLIFPYADGDDSLSAQVAATDAKNNFDQEKLKSYFYGIVNDSTLTVSNKTNAIYGIASLHEPVLVDIYRILGSEDLRGEDRLYLSLSLAELGDYQKSAEILHELESENTVQDQTDQWSMHLTQEESGWIKDSFITADIKALLQEPEADNYFNYAYQHQRQAKGLAPDLLIMQYMEARLRNFPSTSTQVKYSQDGEEHEVSFDTQPSITFTLPPEKQNNFKILQVDGDALVTSRYFTKPTAGENTSSSQLSIKRSYEGDFQDGKIVKVHIDYQVPQDSGNVLFQITDILPAGLQPITQPRIFGGFNQTDYISPYNVDGQRVSFTVTHSNQMSITYYARVVSKGKFTAESPIIQSVEYPDMRSVGNEESITIH